jgi:predicted enzyme related to lactoylglutathione lyase
MTVHWENLVIDAAEPATLAAFWEAALGWEARQVDEGDESYFIVEPPEGDPRRGVVPELDIIAVPEAKTVKNRLHIDLRPDDQAAEVARLEALGARRVDVGQGSVRWVVLADPEGNEFCVLSAPHPA